MIERVEVAGEPRKPLWKKLNPLWWFGNDHEPWPPDWYVEKHQVGRPYWWKVVMWYARNPLHNFGRYVLGLVDRDFAVEGEAPVMCTHYNEHPSYAGREAEAPRWKRHAIIAGRCRLPFVSYDSPSWRFYAGWQHTGFFGFKWYRKG
jgi:hypothetical protein